MVYSCNLVVWCCCSCNVCCFVFFFFFKQKTAYEMRISDWSSDVCSSDLRRVGQATGDRLVETGANLVEAFLGAGAGHEWLVVRVAEIGRASCRERVCQYV